MNSIRCVATYNSTKILIVNNLNRYKMTKIKTLISYTLYTLLCGVIFYYIVTPKIIERRAMDLGLMEYSADKDKMIAKDSLQLSVWDVYYLQYGNMNGY